MYQQRTNGMKYGVIEAIGRTIPTAGSRQYADFLKSLSGLIQFQGD